MLDLQRVKQYTEDGDVPRTSSLGEISFRVDGGLIGSLGTTLQPGDVWSSADSRGGADEENTGD